MESRSLRRRLVKSVAGIAGLCLAMGAQNFVFASEIPEAVNDGSAWRIVKTAWDDTDEAGYSAFVQAIGKSGCTTLGECLSGAANPYRDTDKRRYSGDCADMAYILRAYYAWKNGLPFSYQHAMRTADGKREDLRYSTGGNVVASRRSAIGPTPISAPGFIARIGGEVSTAMFRTHPETGGGRSFDDFYPVKIARDAVRPGVIAYDIFGHAGIVYDVLDDGRVKIVASHPDNSVTRTVYGPNFLRSKPELGAGLKAWRPIELTGATKRDDGAYVGGKIKAAANSAIRNFSVEQYIGNKPHPSGIWHYGEFMHEGRTLRYYDYVRRRLASPDFAYNPVEELRFGLQSVCGDIKARKVAVNQATNARIHLKPHPKRLPPNIFGTYGEWEHYSTPSRDARLKVSFIELRRTMQDLYERAVQGDPSIAFEGGDLAEALWLTFQEEKAACKVSYWRSDDLRVQLNLGHVMDRLFQLSFDPYHCPERRWGARGAELESCTDDQEKTRWYNAQRFLRNQAQRTYDVRMDFTVDELKPPMVAPPSQGGLGVEAPADADLRTYLAGLNGLLVSASYEEGPPLIDAALRHEVTDE
ncbi:MAG: hypothetical protein AAGJ73_13085 [Pseudomonadota bacterium]